MNQKGRSHRVLASWGHGSYAKRENRRLQPEERHEDVEKRQRCEMVSGGQTGRFHRFARPAELRHKPSQAYSVLKMFKVTRRCIHFFHTSGSGKPGKIFMCWPCSQAGWLVFMNHLHLLYFGIGLLLHRNSF